MRVGLLNSGGDCPGLNAVTHGVVGAAACRGWEVVGFRDGYEGLLPPGDFKMLNPEKTVGILKLGGTILGTTNKGHFAGKTGMGEATKIPQSSIDGAKETLDRLEVNGLIVVGGDGSLTTALQLQEAGIPVIGVPKTIDNDIEATATSFGFDSAVAAVVDALDRLHTTAASHKRVMILEVMGRHAGWIAAFGGIAGGANVILVPEIPFSFERVADAIRKREAAGQHTSLVVVAEGAKATDGHQVMLEAVDGGEHRLGGVGEQVSRSIHELTGKDTRTMVLGHLQRGGSPTSLDRVLGTRFGVKAVQLVERGDFGQMVSYQSYHVGSVPISDAVARLKLVDPEGELVETARNVGISFGD